MKSLELKSKLLTEQLLTSDPKKFILLEMKKIGIEKLPYSYSALDKFIDSKTMNVHYNKHYKGYVKKLNKALSEKNYGDVELEEIIKSISRYSKTIRNNAGGAFNHALFWKMLSPKKQECKGEILKKIKKEFGDYQSFKKKFEETAKKSFGSGWIWLSLSDNGRLKIVTTPNQDNPLMNIVKSGGYPILGLDLWEHAYYLKYQSNRDSYISNFWNCVNWEFVEKLYLSRQKKKPLNENTMSTSQNYEYCPKSEVNKYQEVFNKNKKVKWDFNTAILDIFEELFPDNWYEKNEYAEGELAGLYDFRGIPGRSPINYANTNYYCYCVLLNDTNQVLSRAGIPTIEIIGKSEQEQVSENKRFIEFIRHYKDRIFSENSKTFKKLIDITSRSGSRGKQGEEYTIKKIKQYFGEDNVELVGKIGSIKDAKSGIDCKIHINGETKTGQIKPYGFIENKNGNMIFKNTGGVEQYKTDLLIFYRDNSDVYIFDNNKVKIVDGLYHAPETALLYKIN